MIVFHPNIQLAFSQAGFEALAITRLIGGSDGVAAFVEQNAVTTTQSGKRADDMQRLNLGGQALTTLLELTFHAARKLLGQLIQPLT